MFWSSLPLALSLASAVSAQDPCLTKQYPPLVNKRYTYPNLPYKTDNEASCRGPQSGYTLCNSTTAGQNSLCQTAIMNSIDDFCLWGPTKPDTTIGEAEAETVAFCTKDTHGTRVMPAGTITGIQVLKAPGYLLFAGTMDQTKVNIAANGSPKDDGGGELDPHGADLRGNPLGSLVYSNAFPSNGGNLNSYQQVVEWNNFMGSNQFCFKVCDNAVPNSKVYCNNVFDLEGCDFNAPAKYQAGVFEVCDSDNMDPVGIYTTNGHTTKYTRTTPIVTLPSIKTPASSNCKTYASTDIFKAGGLAASPTGTTTSTGTGTASKATTTTTSTGTLTKAASPTLPTSAKSTTAATASARSAASQVMRTNGSTVALGLVTVIFGLGGVFALL